MDTRSGRHIGLPVTDKWVGHDFYIIESSWEGKGLTFYQKYCPKCRDKIRPLDLRIDLKTVNTLTYCIKCKLETIYTSKWDTQEDVNVSDDDIPNSLE